MPGVKDWIAKASGDLKVAKMASLDADVFDIAAYLIHQSAEKSLKSYLVFCGQTILKTHNLILLLEACAKKDQSFRSLFEDILILNPYGVYSRYPDDRFSMTKEEVDEAITKAIKILNFVKKKISEPKNPTQKLFEKIDNQ